MTQNISNENPPRSNPYGFSYMGTTCAGANYRHNHAVPVDSVEVTPGVSHRVSAAPVRTFLGADGTMIRRFGVLSYWPATGQMLITQMFGATGLEVGSLFGTALAPVKDPSMWPVHPCCPERRRISLYRPVDEHYLAEAEEAFFADLERSEQATALSSRAEGLTNA